jgi:putative acyl-CoA dehydrogenase
MARIYREAPLNSVWEGSGNIQCLDVLRALEKNPESHAALRSEIDAGSGDDRRLDRFTANVYREIEHSAEREGSARRWVEGLALALQGSLLVRFAPRAVADAFCASRLSDGRHGAFGTLPSGVDLQPILARHAPDAV